MIRRNLMAMTLMAVSLSMMAQEEDWTRGRIENVSEPVAQTASGKHRIGSTATAPLVCTGSPKVPVVLVQFADLAFSVAEDAEGVKAAYEDFFSAGEGVHPGTSYCSVREYFRMQSEGKFTPDIDVIGPVTLSQSYTYYGEDSGSAKDIHINDFFREACKLAMQNDVDWSQYDNDGNGVVDFVFFIYAGLGQNQKNVDSGAIWPKESTSRVTVENNDFSVTFGAYGCTNELYNSKMDGIGACVHELCHGLGLPDFYDTNYKAYGLDYWDVMDSGCYQITGRMPCCMSAYELDFMGWRKLEEVAADAECTLTIEPLEKGGVAYKVVNPANADEYFILENRQNIGCDTYFGWPTSTYYQKYGANHGLMITHVDYDKSAWSSNRVNTNTAHQRITLVPADGELVSSIDRTDNVWAHSLHGDLYPCDTLNVTEMTSYAVFTGETLGVTIDNIVEEEDGTIKVNINGGTKEPDTPENPDDPDTPDNPEDPENPDDPDTPTTPEDPLIEPDVPQLAQR